MSDLDAEQALAKLEEMFKTDRFSMEHARGILADLEESAYNQGLCSGEVSIMPLVEENRKLHDRVRVLQLMLEEQNVRVDRLVENAPKLLCKVGMSVSASELMMAAAHEASTDGTVRFELYFLGAKK